MAISRIEQLIEEIYEFIESCKMQPLSSTRVVGPKDEVYDLLDELRLRTPDEIKRYQKIISNRDAILSDADRKSQDIIAQTKEQAQQMLDEHEIMQQAYYEANELVMKASKEAERLRKEAQEEADQIRSASLVYCHDMLSNVEAVLANTYEDSLAKYDGFIGTLKDSLDIIIDNKVEISQQLYPEQNRQDYGLDESYQEELYQDEQEIQDVQDEEDDYNFDEDTFLDGHI